MVSFAPNTQSYLFNHMSSFEDDRFSNKKPQMCLNKGSIYDFIQSNHNFSKFKMIVDRAQMNGFLDSDQANCTVFIPSDNYLSDINPNFFHTMDTGLARDILAASTIPKRLRSDLLTSSPVCYYYTKNPEMRIYMTNISNKTRLNDCVNILKFDILLNNGVIHLIDGLIVPTQAHFMN